MAKCLGKIHAIVIFTPFSLRQKTDTFMISDNQNILNMFDLAIKWSISIIFENWNCIDLYVFF